MYHYHMLQADEPHVPANKDGRLAGWITMGQMYAGRQIVLYEYQKAHNSSHTREVLRWFIDICVTDGYQPTTRLKKNGKT